MKISVAIGALNEGPQLLATVSNLLACVRPPEEIVVVDDNSLVPASLPDLPGVRVIREESRLGSGPAKHKAASLCTGDLIVVLDAHMRVGQDFFPIIEDEAKRTPWAVLNPRNHGLECNSTHNGMGGRFETGSGFWHVKWNDPRPDAWHSYCVPAAIGGCYCVPRHLLDRVGGYAPGFYGYGVEEEYLSIRAWVVGGEVRCVPRAEAWHYYRRPIDRRTADGVADPTWAGCFNRHVAAMVCFQPHVYEKHYKPRLDPITDPQVFERLESCKDEIESVRSIVNSNRQQNDASLARWCGLVHP